MENKQYKKLVSALSGAMALIVMSLNAQAFESMKMGEWDVDISGNINGFVTNVDCNPNGNGVVQAGLACGSNGSDRKVGSIRTGLLPSWFGFHAKQVNDSGLTTELNIGFQPGIDGGAQSNELDGALQNNSENLRQVNLKFGSSWGTIMIGRDLGVFGSDAILSDMTLLGVGTVSDLTAGGGNTSLGRIGVGYLYADWKAQVQYASPNWDGFSFAFAVVDPWGLAGLSSTSLNSSSFGQLGDTYGFEGKASFEWGGGANSTMTGKVWAGFITQSLDTSSASFTSQDATGYDVGAKVGFGGLELVAYLYDGDGIGTTGFLLDAVDSSGNTRDSDGYYVQAAYKLPQMGTKFGISVGESNLDRGPGDGPLTSLVKTNESYVVGVYHPLTQSLNLVLEYTKTDASAHNGNTATESTLAIGAILFY